VIANGSAGSPQQWFSFSSVRYKCQLLPGNGIGPGFIFWAGLAQPKIQFSFDLLKTDQRTLMATLLPFANINKPERWGKSDGILPLSADRVQMNWIRRLMLPTALHPGLAIRSWNHRWHNNFDFVVGRTKKQLLYQRRLQGYTRYRIFSARFKKQPRWWLQRKLPGSEERWSTNGAPERIYAY